MTEAGWTREKPTAAGFWWWRQSDRVKYSYIVEVDSEMNVWFHGKEDESRVDYLTGEWLGPITPDSYQQGRVAANVDALVDRFLAWPLPASVCSDLCATKQGYPHRSGTNLLSAAEARAMLEYVLGIESLAQQAQGGVEE